MTAFPTHSIFYNIPAILAAGARCRTCSRVLPATNRPAEETFCPAHDHSNESEEAVLGRFCCEFQDLLAAWCRNRRPTEPQYPDATASQNWWWDKTFSLRCQCENSLCELSGFWKAYLGIEGEWHTEHQVAIDKVYEVKFWSGPYYWYIHCVFLVRLRSGACYIFDPTGVQFGPEWAVLSPLEQYKLHFWDQPELQPLGTNHEEREMERRGLL